MPPSLKLPLGLIVAACVALLSSAGAAAQSTQPAAAQTPEPAAAKAQQPAQPAGAAARSQQPTFGACKVNAGAAGQGGAPADPELTSGVRIEVKGGDGKPVRGERFYLLTKKAGDAGLDWTKAPARAKFFEGASPELMKVLDESGCDTLFCPELIGQYPKLVEDVREFREAYAAGMRKYKDRRLALEWLMVNFPRKELRMGYYESKRAWLAEAAKRGGAVASVMTNEDGEAFFTRIRLGRYYVSNLMPAGPARLVWDCEVTVPPPSKKELHSASVVMSAPKAGEEGAASK
ncbi:MAG TPA: hypothetical protein VEY09_09745 [Pyrinomonadaceae bacterium]|nr:hypothetical protein [Pyrinomonadaceae bacterium]